MHQQHPGRGRIQRGQGRAVGQALQIILQPLERCQQARRQQLRPYMRGQRIKRAMQGEISGGQHGPGIGRAQRQPVQAGHHRVGLRLERDAPPLGGLLPGGGVDQVCGIAKARCALGG